MGETATTRSSTDRVRIILARVVWGVCVLLAVILAAAALCITLDAEAKNGLVSFLLDSADNVDLGIFDLQNPIKDFDDKTGPTQDTKTALFSYGLGAVVYLVIGRVLDRLIRP